jgi:hypothetical protein
MLQRCENKNASNFHNYGGRGIVVSSDWHDFTVFLKDMGDRPLGMTLKRKNPNGNYCKENCKWATHKEQRHNKRIDHEVAGLKSENDALRRRIAELESTPHSHPNSAAL